LTSIAGDWSMYNELYIIDKTVLMYILQREWPRCQPINSKKLTVEQSRIELEWMAEPSGK